MTMILMMLKQFFCKHEHIHRVTETLNVLMDVYECEKCGKKTAYLR